MAGAVFNVVPSLVVPNLRPNTDVNRVVSVDASSGVNVSVSPTYPEISEPVGIVSCALTNDAIVTCPNTANPAGCVAVLILSRDSLIDSPIFTTYEKS